ncbi:hypothetical protein Tco_0969499 [Tanacetum coccineum]
MCHNHLTRGRMEREPTLLEPMRRNHMLGVRLTATSVNGIIMGRVLKNPLWQNKEFYHLPMSGELRQCQE